MRIPRRLAFWVLLLATTAGRGVGSPSDPVVDPSGGPREAAGFTFRVTTPAVSLAADPEGRFKIKIEGFGALNRRPEAPDLPQKVVRVAIPEGAVPRLELRLEGAEDLHPGVRPRAVASALVDLAAADGEAHVSELRRESASIYDGAEPYPHALAWLGETGVLRDQRFVEVHLAPVRYDPAIHGLRIARSFEVTVLFDGTVAARTAPLEDPLFEKVYRSSFVNYAQGKTFRLGTREGPGRGGSPMAAVPAADSPALPEVTPRYRITVSRNGAVRLDYARMATTGFLAYPLSSWKLESNGVEVPLDVHDPNGNDQLDNVPAQPEWVQFYGQALDFDSKTVLNTDQPGPADIYEARDFTDQNVYFLTVETGPRVRMPAVAADPTFTRTPPTDFEAVSHVETDDSWRPLGGADPWYSDPAQSYPQQGTLVPSRTVSVPLAGLASTTAPVTVLVNLRGVTEDSTTFPDHRAQVSLRNALGQQLVAVPDDGTWDGRTLFLYNFTWSYGGSGSVASNPVQVRIDAQPSGGAAGYYNQFILDYVEARYRRVFQASSDALQFSWPDADAEFIVTGLSSASPGVYELTGTVGATGIVSATRLTGAVVSGTGPYSVRFRMDNSPTLADGTPRRFLVAGDAAATIPADTDFTADAVSDLRNTANQADLIVIAPAGLVDLGPSSSLTQYLAFRASQGVVGKVARLEDVYDEFNDGLPGPVAIRNFLRWVMSTAPGEGWTAPKPSYVLLLGDGSYDYKAGSTNGTYVPTSILFEDNPFFGYYASDNLMAAVVGNDNLPDLAIGRLPARSLTQANALLDKVRTYEQAPPTGNWRRHALFVSDRGKGYDPDEAAEFEAINDQAESHIKRPPYTDRKLRYWTDYCGGVPANCNPNTIRSDIKAAVNGSDGFSNGAAVMQFIGHGNFDVWSDDAFFDNRLTKTPRPDTDDLVNGYRLPWLIAQNCLTGGFMSTAARTLGKDFVNKTDGGAIAVLSPSGLSGPTYHGLDVSDAIFGDLFGPPKERRIAVPVLDTASFFCVNGVVESCQNFVLLGDPATRLVIPSVGAATNVAANGGNAVVSLSWTASVTAGVTYDVYRTLNPLLASPVYTKVNAASISGTSYQDTSAANATTYYYYVLATDPSGFESPWSNFNSDCSVSGPDCVQATPLNPNPPGVPTGFAVVDAMTSGRLNLTWNANAETDLKNYTVHFGTAPGVYDSHLDVGKVTAYQLIMLTDNVRYYLTITATNTSGKTSAYAPEKSEFPTFVRGVASPDFVDTLTVSKSGQDAQLTWGAVTTNIYGRATTIARYEVYRATTPSFTLASATLLGTTTSTTYADIGALDALATSYYYAVRGVDADGNPGGLGNQLPDGIGALAVAHTTGHVVLSWLAITATFDPPKWPTAIDHYDVYATDHPFTRANIRDGTVPKIATTAGTSVDVGLPASSLYYSVLSVDTKGNVSPY